MHYLLNLLVAGTLVMQQSMALPTMLLNAQPQNAFMSMTQPQVMQSPMNYPPNSIASNSIASNGQPFNLVRPPIQPLPVSTNVQPAMQPNALFRPSTNNAMLTPQTAAQNGFMLPTQGTPNAAPITTCRYQIKFTLKPGANALLNEFNVQSELKRILNLVSLDALNYQNWKLQQDGIIMDAPREGITRLPLYNGKLNQAAFNGIRLDDNSPFDATVANEVCVTIFP